jgi:hypothetical protein
MVVEDSEVQEIARAQLESQELAEEMEMMDTAFKMKDTAFKIEEQERAARLSFFLSMKEEHERATRESLGPALANNRGTETEFLNVAVS